MTLVGYLLAAFFLPLFPFSMVFNRLFAKVRDVRLRALLLLAWPQAGILLLTATDATAPQWLQLWALGSAALYAFRALALREVGIWTGFLATSVWGVLWVPATAGGVTLPVPWYALGFSVPLVLLTYLTDGLERRFGAAYTGLHGGLAMTTPRLSLFLVLTVLAVVATPLFPGFFAMLGSIIVASSPTALALVGIWLLWSWTAARLLQGLIVGPLRTEAVPDLSTASSWGYAILLGALLIGGPFLTGGM